MIDEILILNKNDTEPNLMTFVHQKFEICSYNLVDVVLPDKLR